MDCEKLMETLEDRLATSTFSRQNFTSWISPSDMLGYISMSKMKLECPAVENMIQAHKRILCSHWKGGRFMCNNNTHIGLEEPR